MAIELMETTLRYYHQPLKLLMIALADFANEDGYSWPSVQTLALYQSKEERQTQMDIKKLIERGDIIVIPGGDGPRDTNKYMIVWDKLPDDLLESLKTTFGATNGRVIFEDIMQKRTVAESVIKPLSSKGLGRVQLLESRRKTRFVDALLNPLDEGGYLFVEAKGAVSGAMGAVATAPIFSEGCSSLCTLGDAKGAVATAPEPLNVINRHTHTTVGFGGAGTKLFDPGEKVLVEDEETAPIRNEQKSEIPQEIDEDVSYVDEDPENPVTSKSVQTGAVKADTPFQKNLLDALRLQKFYGPADKAKVSKLERDMENSKQYAELHPGEDLLNPHPDWIEEIITWVKLMNKKGKVITFIKFFSAINNQARFDIWASARGKPKKGVRIGKPKSATR